MKCSPLEEIWAAQFNSRLLCLPLVKVLAWGGAPVAPPLAEALSGVDDLLEEGEPLSSRSVVTENFSCDNLAAMHILASVRLNK